MGVVWNLTPMGRVSSATAARRLVVKKLALALALLLSATSVTLAQSQRNYGPNGPSKGNCYGSPYSGTIASRCPGEHQ
jgi:hypothetical protein